MQNINHHEYINYLISQPNSEIDAAVSTARGGGGGGVQGGGMEGGMEKSALPVDLREKAMMVVEWRGGRKQGEKMKR